MNCRGQLRFDLTGAQISELLRTQELRLLCPVCQALTSWNALQLDRRSGQDRRASRHGRMALPIRVRCDLPELKFTEVTQTLTASGRGASFVSHHALREGMTVHVVVLFGEEASTLFETRAHVVRTERKNDGYEVGIQLLV